MQDSHRFPRGYQGRLAWPRETHPTRQVNLKLVTRIRVDLIANAVKEGPAFAEEKCPVSVAIEDGSHGGQIYLKGKTLVNSAR